MRPIMIATAAVVALHAASSPAALEFVLQQAVLRSSEVRAGLAIAASTRWSSAGEAYMEASTAAKISPGSRTDKTAANLGAIPVK